MRREGEHHGVGSVVLAGLRIGDWVEFRTANSAYRFWVEFPECAVGVAEGGRLLAPTRVRLTPEGAGTDEPPARALRTGERVQLELLGPDGAVRRRFLTSTVASIDLHLRGGDRRAA